MVCCKVIGLVVVNIALVLAGGSGTRFGSGMPKQFVEVLGKPVIVYTLEALEASESIDAVCVVCIATHQQLLDELIAHYHLAKVRWTVPGGASYQESARNGICYLRGVAKSDDILMMIMSVQPLISDDIIKDSMAVCMRYGNAVAGTEAIYNFSPIHDDVWSDSYTLKHGQMTLNLPWTFPFGYIDEAYQRAEGLGIGMGPFDYAPTMLIDLGEKIYFSKDSSLNQLKITTPNELALFESYLLLRRSRKKGNRS